MLLYGLVSVAYCLQVSNFWVQQQQGSLRRRQRRLFLPSVEAHQFGAQNPGVLHVRRHRQHEPES